jgi:hypothetical protein
MLADSEPCVRVTGDSLAIARGNMTNIACVVRANNNFFICFPFVIILNFTPDWQQTCQAKEERQVYKNFNHFKTKD